MKLRALQPTAVQGPRGTHYLNGPTVVDNPETGKVDLVKNGDMVDVPDDFLVQPEVFEVMEQLPTHPGVPPQFRPMQKGDPRLKNVRFALTPAEQRAAEEKAEAEKAAAAGAAIAVAAANAAADRAAGDKAAADKKTSGAKA